MKKQIALLFWIVALTANLFAQSSTPKALYKSGVYGQTFYLYEYTDGNNCQLLLFMSDNGTKQTKTYDSSVATVYYVWSKWFSSPSEYSESIELSKSFFDVSMNFVSLAEMKDICDIAPCCTTKNYSIREAKDGQKYICIEYDCSDLELLFEIASVYNRKSRAYVLEKYY